MFECEAASTPIELGVEHSPQQDRVHGEIEAEHADHRACEGAVHGGERTRQRQIGGERGKGHDHREGRERGTRQELPRPDGRPGTSTMVSVLPLSSAVRT